jgi:signal transduction histidine kinase
MMQANSLATRLILTSAVIACTLLVLAGLLLGNLFQRALERNFDSRLEAVMDGLIANVIVKSDGTPELGDQVSDTRFTLPDSGWYWQVVPPDASDAKALVSPSLLSNQLDVPSENARFYLEDRKGQRLRAIRQPYKLLGATEPYAITVAGNFDELETEVKTFRNILLSILGLLGLGLLGAILFQVRFGLKPLAHMQKKLSAIRNGEAQSLDGNFPSELQPVAAELNLLIRSNRDIVERARMQVGNLAHALKTPISVLTNEAGETRDPLAAKVREQLSIIRQHIDHYLERARAAARAQSIGTSSDVAPVIEALARTLPRIYRDKNLQVDTQIAPGLRFRGEHQDLEEMVGNLMDNAAKWTQHKIDVTAAISAKHADGRNFLVIQIDDDGPGLPEDQREKALQRGQRLDESKPGSGLGLNIVSETASLYGGELVLSEAPGGGLRAILHLPATATRPD